MNENVRCRVCQLSCTIHLPSVSLSSLQYSVLLSDLGSTTWRIWAEPPTEGRDTELLISTSRHNGESTYGTKIELSTDTSGQGRGIYIRYNTNFGVLAI